MVDLRIRRPGKGELLLLLNLRACLAPQMRIRLILDGDIHDYDRDLIRYILSKILHVDDQSVHILNIEKGGGIISMELPEHKVKLILDGDVRDFDRDLIPYILSKILHVDDQSVHILNIEKGGVIISIELPEDAALELAFLVRSRGPRL